MRPDCPSPLDFKYSRYRLTVQGPEISPEQETIEIVGFEGFI